jgi:hypothetical protein
VSLIAAHLDRKSLDVKRFERYCLGIEIFEAERQLGHSSSEGEKTRREPP